jgi:FdhD protein
MTTPVREVTLYRFRQDKLETVSDRVVVEEPLEIRLAGEPFQVLMRLPGWEKELALGFLFTEGIVRSLHEVITIHFCGTATDPLLPPNVVDVSLTAEALGRRGRRRLEVSYSSCGLCAKVAVAEICQKLPPVASDLSIASLQLLALMSLLPEAQPVFQETGGTHAVALASPDGGVFIAAEDVDSC